MYIHRWPSRLLLSSAAALRHRFPVLKYRQALKIVTQVQEERWRRQFTNHTYKLAAAAHDAAYAVVGFLRDVGDQAAATDYVNIVNALHRAAEQLLGDARDMADARARAVAAKIAWRRSRAELRPYRLRVPCGWALADGES